MDDRKRIPLRMTPKEDYYLRKLKERYPEFSLNDLVNMAITKLAYELGFRYTPDGDEGKAPNVS